MIENIMDVILTPGFLKVAIVGYGTYWVLNKLKNSKFKSLFKKKRTLTPEEIDRYIKKESLKMKDTVYMEDFYKVKKNLERRGFECPGVYIFTNLRNGRKYVGQSVNILNRVNTHIKGRGSQDLHEDMLLGHEFIIQFIKLKDTRFKNLNDLERYYIKKMNAFTQGYNKTRGNK